jgi:multidrug efflux pump
MSRFFVDHPVFAWVVSIVIVTAGLACVVKLPIAQYPPIVPPTVQVTATYPGASANTLADTVGQPIEEQVNGVESMIYMSSTCTNNGQYTLTISFDVGTDIHTALMLVQVRTQLAMPQLPTTVQKQGVNVQMKSPNILLTVNLVSPDDRYDALYLSNYAQINLFDDLSRLKGVGLVTFLGQREYSMRAWLDPQKLAALDMTASEVTIAIQEQNVDVAPGNIGQQPVPKGQNYQIVLNAQGRLRTEQQFGNIIVKVGQDGRLVYLRDVARLELGSQNSDLNCYLAELKDGKVMRHPSVALAIFTLPQANALDVGQDVKKKMEELKKKFPKGLEYRIPYDTTPFIHQSVDNVRDTIIIAALLVIVVVMVFLQDWRAMLLPMIDIVVSLIGTFAVMALLGFSLNNLSLFGLVLAVGIVVDDSIVVVENVERWMGTGLAAREATLKAMGEITGPVIGVTLVLSSVFIPTAFMPGLTGQFFRQFALTIACAAIISATNAMTLSPARAVAWIKPHRHGEIREALPAVAYSLLFGGLTGWLLVPFLLPHLRGLISAGAYSEEVELGVAWAVCLIAGGIPGWFLAKPINRILGSFFGLFNKVFDVFTNGYGRLVSLALRLSLIVLVLYVGLLTLTGFAFTTSPTGFIPDQDQGYVLVNVTLPNSASVQRTAEVSKQLEEIALNTRGVKQTMSISGFSAFFQCDSSNWGTIFVILDDFDKRTTPETQAAAIIRKLNVEFHEKVLSCQAPVFGAPPVPGLGQSGGFQLQIVDRTGMGLQALQEATDTIVQKANAQPGLEHVFTTFSANTPQLYIDIDREKAKDLGVALGDVFNTLNSNMGSVYINQFNEFGRIWQVNIQAEGSFRTNVDNLGLLQVRNRQGDSIPLSTLIRVRNDSGPVFVMRYNDMNSSAINGGTKPGFSSGQAVAVMEQLCDENLPAGMGYEWTNISYQETHAGGSGIAIFGLGVLLIFLVLAALYESWKVPFSIILVVPMCLLSAIAGLVWIAHKPIDIFSQIGFVVLVAMAAKNAILIVAYARDKRSEGLGRREATVEACKQRLRPILMTSFAFIMGVYPLVVASGAGWEMQRSLGTAVFSGMIGVTFFGIFLTPVFYYVITTGEEEKKPLVPSAGPGPDGQHKAATAPETAVLPKPGVSTA